MKRIEVLAEKFKDVKQVRYLEAMICLRMDFIKSIRADEFIYTSDFFRKSFGDQVEDFDEFFEYVMFVMLENGFEVGNLNENAQINKFPDGSIIDYNWDNKKKAKMIVSSWNRSVEMFPFETLGDGNYITLRYELSTISPRLVYELKLKEIIVEEDECKGDKCKEDKDKPFNRIEMLKEKFRYVKLVETSEVAVMNYLELIKSYGGVSNFIHTADYLRITFGDQVEDFNEFFEYVMLLILEEDFRVGLEVKKDPINTLLDGSIIDYNRSNEENAKLIVSSWNRSVEMYPIVKIGDKNYSKLATLSIFLPRFIED